MSEKEFLQLFTQSHKIKKLRDEIENKEQLHLAGLCGSGNSLAIGSLFKAQQKTQLILLNDKEEAAYIYNDLQKILKEEEVLFFPASYKKPYQIEQTDNANVLLRTETLHKLSSSDNPKTIVSYPGAMTEKVIARQNLKQNTLKIHKGEKVSVDFITEILQEYEFEMVDFVIEPGHFSVRGGIIDVFSYSEENPFRLELFGDEIESIRSFNPVDQLSIEAKEVIEVIPNLQGRLTEENRHNFLEFIAPTTTIWIEDIDFTLDQLKNGFEAAQIAYLEQESEIKHLTPEALFIDENDFLSALKSFKTIETGQNNYFQSDTFTFNQSPPSNFKKKFDLLAEEFVKNTNKNYQNLLLAANQKQIDRLNAIFEDSEEEKPNYDSLLFVLHGGFIDHDLKIACYTDHQIFNRFHRFNLKNAYNKKTQAITLKELQSLQPGDYVTHIDHGIGKFSGLETMDVQGKKQEAIRLVYKNNDLLYVSIHSLHKIAKYTGKDGVPPNVDKLGSGHWQKVKNKTKKKVKKLAYDLIKLYAERKSAKGFSYMPNNYLMNELEANFIYEETPDQITVMDAVTKDMEAQNPMDRLVCGDVGFGKTEIAIRAAFKAACDNQQVAILAPTTILTLQHYKTFKERLAEFPVKVDYINRFKSAKQQKETLKKLAAGEIDIIIGTHRLAGKDIKFKSLGLLIIDEEQKFGVSVKDKLKTLKVNVDTLTLTATPIPRTLQFSLMNARDLSIISTPPPNRRPIETTISTFSEEVIRDAISYETARGGQVFFIHNRIRNIKEMAGMIQRLCPDARVLIAHGQMNGSELEEKMMAFINEEYDVLVATTIVESGLDIPNANTIIINNANTFGLSDLHQMRGRTGRSNKKAFCHLIAPPTSSLTPEARKRLKAIEQFSDLGSGLQIAMRDLDIRGAGDILGAEQSGFIADMGIDMYQKILKQAVQELKETEFKELYQEELEEKNYVSESQIESDLDIFIPDDYVSNVAERISLYTEIDNIKDNEELEIFKKKMEDRFGQIPKETEGLFKIIELRKTAEKIGIEKLVLKQGRMICYFIADQEAHYYKSTIFQKVLKSVQKQTYACKMKEKNNKLMLSFPNIKNIQKAYKALSVIIEREQEDVKVS